MTPDPPRPVGRPPKPEGRMQTVGVTLPPEVIEALRAEGPTISAAIRKRLGLEE